MVKDERINDIITVMRKRLEVLDPLIIPVYGGASIKIEEYGLYIWIRVKHTSDNNIILDFSNVQIPEKHRRKGLFTGLINDLQKLSYINNILITQIMTEEMMTWVNKCDWFRYDLNCFSLYELK